MYKLSSQPLLSLLCSEGETYGLDKHGTSTRKHVGETSMAIESDQLKNRSYLAKPPLARIRPQTSVYTCSFCSASLNMGNRIKGGGSEWVAVVIPCHHHCQMTQP